MEITRRELVRGVALGGAAALVNGRARSAETPAQAESSAGELSAEAKRTAPGDHPVVPLPFDPKTLRGLSEKLIRSHHENNYRGAVRNLNRVERELATLSPDAPGYRVAGLRQRELMFRNSAVLHELYFANLGGNGEPEGEVASALSSAFGTRDGFEARFRATARSLSGGSGWALLSYDFFDGGLRIQWAGDHTQTWVDAEPLLVLDMYEHSYHLDYGARAAAYIDAFMRNVDWRVVDRRRQLAVRIAAQRRS